MLETHRFYGTFLLRAFVPSSGFPLPCCRRLGLECGAENEHSLSFSPGHCSVHEQRDPVSVLQGEQREREGSARVRHRPQSPHQEPKGPTAHHSQQRRRLQSKRATKYKWNMRAQQTRPQLNLEFTGVYGWEDLEFSPLGHCGVRWSHTAPRDCWGTSDSRNHTNFICGVFSGVRVPEGCFLKGEGASLLTLADHFNWWAVYLHFRTFGTHRTTRLVCVACGRRWSRTRCRRPSAVRRISPETTTWAMDWAAIHSSTTGPCPTCRMKDALWGSGTGAGLTRSLESRLLLHCNLLFSTEDLVVLFLYFSQRNHCARVCGGQWWWWYFGETEAQNDQCSGCRITRVLFCKQ